MTRFTYQRIIEFKDGTGGRLFGSSGYLCDGLEDAFHPVKTP